MSGEQSDWAAIAKAGVPAEQYGEWLWFDGKESGVLHFTHTLAQGRYEDRAALRSRRRAREQRQDYGGGRGAVARDGRAR
jgi:hypothetical protein